MILQQVANLIWLSTLLVGHSLGQSWDPKREQKDERRIQLESMEDLEDVAYLSMRNFNITDHMLMQSSWLGGSSSSSTYKQLQKVAAATGGSSELSSDDLKGKLALMLESFISHLRNGHLKRLELEELEQILAALNGSEMIGRTLETTTGESIASGQINFMEKPERCRLLTAIYRIEVRERQKTNSMTGNHSENGTINYTHNLEQSNLNEPSSDGQIDMKRLMRLCELAVNCHSADELVSVIGNLWRLPASSEQVKTKQNVSPDLELENPTLGRQRESEWSRPKTLRDSLSMSLAKLCPLMLFQLHDEEGLCSIRRDDRPPMIAVWGFATLFVTIVSFCSLIGLSIAPLLGPSASDISSNSSEQVSNANSHRNRAELSGSPSLATSGSNWNGLTPGRQHRDCLTLFEGLAVGSLVGSALFSLIPQAFELQERESNRGFLLKALIIFFGIYLFFCSERIMRIILDTRQKRKKNNRINHRSSNSLPLPPSALLDLEQQQVQLERQNNTKDRSHNLAVRSGRLPISVRAFTELHSRDDCRKSKSRAQHFAPNQHVKISRATTSSDGTKGVIHFHRNNIRAAGGENCFPNDQSAKSRLATSSDLMSAKSRSSAKATAGVGLRNRHSRRTRRARKTKNQLMAAIRQRHRRQRLEQLPRPSDEDLNSNMLNSSSSSNSLPSRPSHSSGVRRRKHNLAQFALSQDCSAPESSAYLSASNSSNDDEYAFESDQSDDDDNQQMLAVNKQMKLLYSKRYSQDNNQQSFNQYLRGRPELMKTSFLIDSRHSPSPGQNQAENGEQDISTVAWMIILGDGLHNFIDGISIGAAFSESILSGVSISVAVICEEFPHELGDFAVLVSSGMTVHQALGYNFLSACTCYLGMAVGIILGDVNDSASYISALAAGVFLYIALVDMMGDLSATLEETSRYSIAKTLKLLLLQNVGIFIGISIIFVLSFIDF